MTTDITNVQNAFMMIIRVAVRSPLSFVFSYIMCLIISPKLSLTFLLAVIFLDRGPGKHHGGDDEDL